MAIKFLNKGLARKYQDMAKKLPEVKNRVLHDVAEEARADFEKTVESWKNKPKFEIDERERSIAVTTEDKIFRFVDEGTKPHTIRAKNQNALAFQGGYQAKTTPRMIASRPGGPSGPVVFAVEVHHSGTEAREFTKTIYNKWQREFTNRMRQALKQGIESVGL